MSEGTMAEKTEREQIKEGAEVVYFVAIRATARKGGNEISEAMKALSDAGLLPEPGEATGEHHAVAWYRPYADLAALDHDRLRALGLGFDDANRIVTVAWEQS